MEIAGESTRKQEKWTLCNQQAVTQQNTRIDSSCCGVYTLMNMHFQSHATHPALTNLNKDSIGDYRPKLIKDIIMNSIDKTSDSAFLEKTTEILESISTQSSGRDTFASMPDASSSKETEVVFIKNAVRG